MFSNVLQNIKNVVIERGHFVAESLTPILTESKFAETGSLTPIEFVSAGDTLVHKCPSWKWISSIDSRSYLPQDKQYLFTKGIPCMPTTLIALQEDDEGWLNTEDVKCIPNDEQLLDDDKYIDLETLIEDPDNSAVHLDTVMKTSTYDISIIYDKYYQVPRMFLVGFDSSGIPLSCENMLKDVSQDHSNKTATIERHPFTNIQCISIHPCNHGHIMKKFSDHLKHKDKINMYMFVYLKLMQGLIPSLNYDFTTGIEFEVV